MNYKHHIIHNFPPNYPFWKKILANIIFFFGGMIVHKRKNLLNNWDFIRATHKLKEGDVVLVGGMRRVVSFVIGIPINHCLIYRGKRRFVHSVADGVEYASFHDVFCEYDTMAVLRPKNISQSAVVKAIEFAEQQVGKPYNYDLLKTKNDAFCCTQLVDGCYKNVGFDCGLKSEDLIKPTDFINEAFETIFVSHNLKFNNGKFELLENISNK
ncbi:MAG: hypothetical protein ACD_72C00244G0006 [uncultured bacterium]|nr:MAG: hypothetical protein ACD_72C00244G0006 [uncultured bacterium]